MLRMKAKLDDRKLSILLSFLVNSMLLAVAALATDARYASCRENQVRVAEAALPEREKLHVTRRYRTACPFGYAMVYKDATGEARQLDYLYCQGSQWMARERTNDYTRVAQLDVNSSYSIECRRNRANEKEQRRPRTFTTLSQQFKAVSNRARFLHAIAFGVAMLPCLIAVSVMIYILHVHGRTKKKAMAARAGEHVPQQTVIEPQEMEKVTNMDKQSGLL